MSDRNDDPDSSTDILKCLDPAAHPGQQIRGRVYKVKLCLNWRSPEHGLILGKGSYVAIKRQVHGERMKLVREYRLLVSLKHPNVVRVFKLEENKEDEDFMLMELAENTLGDFLHRSHRTRFNTDEYSLQHCCVWLLQVAEAMQFLHEKKVLHRDIKSHNVLMFHRHTVCKVCDLDVSKYDDCSVNTSGCIGTTGWRAPEMRIIGRYPYNRKVDCYSFGVVAAEAVSRLKPGGENPPPYDLDKMKEVFNLGEEATVDVDACRSLLVLVKNLLRKEPNLRPDFSSSAKRLKDIVEQTGGLQIRGISPLKRITSTASQPSFDDESLSHQRTTDALVVHKVFYDVYITNANGELYTEITSEEKRRISDVLNANGLKINKRAQRESGGRLQWLPQLEHRFAAYLRSAGFYLGAQHSPGDKLNFCLIEHSIIDQSNDGCGSIVEEYCSTRSYLAWLAGLFMDEPLPRLETMEFRISIVQNPPDADESTFSA